MRIWNVSEKKVEKMYNSRIYTFQPNESKELSDDVAVFLLSKREVRGQGLVQLKDGDNKEDRYKEGRQQIFNWASEKYNDYERHCEEREAQRLQPLKPHPAILEYKRLMEDYEKWIENGSQVKEEFQEIVGKEKVYVCPHCNKEFTVKVAYFGHLRSHQKERNGDTVSVSNTS